MAKTVLLTGISGYIGLHCAQQLLESGYKVRGSVRSAAKEQAVLDTLGTVSDKIEHLSFVRLDLSSDKGWDEAAMGCDYVLHVASPFVLANPKTEDEMIKPAVNGTLLALKAAKHAGVKRVVLTSSMAAIMGNKKSGTMRPEDWADVSEPKMSTYFKSKTLAEKAAWEFVNAQTGDDKLELTVINPGGVFGPPLGRDISGQSMDMLSQMLGGKMPMVPDVAFPMVDVRDVARLHVEAMTHPEANGLRIIAASSEAHSFIEVAQILNDGGYKGPSTRKAPSFLLRIMSLFDREAKGMVGILGMNVHADNSKTRALFDWKPISFKDSVLASAEAVTEIIRGN